MLGQLLRVRAGFLAVGVLALTGCGPFFIKPTGGGGTGSTGNLVYVANTTTSTVSGFTVGTGTLSNVPNMPYAIGFVPTAAVVTLANTFLYVAGPGAIYAYIIGSDGSLTVPSIGAGQAIVYALSLDISPDGNWLIALDGTSTQLDIYAINQSTGALTLNATAPYSISNAQVTPKMVKVAPGGGLIFAALGTGGDVVFTFNTSTGAAVLSQTLAPISTQTSENALAVDSTNTHLYIARSGVGGGLGAYTIGTAGALTPVTGSPFAAGTQPLGVALDSTSTHAYVANGSDGTISGYSLSSGGVATVLSGSPYASGASVRSLTLAKGGSYLLAVASAGSPDLTMYSFDSTGKLVQATTAATGTDPAGAILAVTSH